MPNSDLEREILDFVGAPGYRPVKPRVIAKHLHISEDDRPDFKRVLKRLVKSGRLAYGSSHLILPVATLLQAQRKPQEAEGDAEGDKPLTPSPSPARGEAGKSVGDGIIFWTRDIVRILSPLPLRERGWG